MKLEIVEGPEGQAVYLDDYRIAGPKPWGGGRLVKSWTVDRKNIQTAMRPKAQNPPPGYPLKDSAK